MYDIDKLNKSEERINSAFSEVTESVNEYFNDFGDKNGMDFKYEFVKYQELLNDINEKYKKIFKRVRERIEYKNSEEVNNSGEKTSAENKPKIFRKRFS